MHAYYDPNPVPGKLTLEMSGGFVDLTLESDSEEDEPLVVFLPFELQKRPGMTKRWKSVFFACIALKVWHLRAVERVYKPVTGRGYLNAKRRWAEMS